MPDPGEAPEVAGGAGADAGEQPDEEELRRQLEEEIRKVRVQDVIAQSLVSVLNLAGRRLLKEDERDLEQARLGIEASRAWIELLEPELAAQVRQALAELQLQYAKLAGGEGGGGDTPEPPPDGPRKPPSGLWTPGGSA